MKSFNEWLKDKNLEENIADYVPGIIRDPLQRMGLLGRTTAGQKIKDQLDAENEKREMDQMRRKARMTAPQNQSGPRSYEFRKDGFSDNETVPNSQSAQLAADRLSREIKQAELDAGRETNPTIKRQLWDKFEQLKKQRDALHAAISRNAGSSSR